MSKYVKAMLKEIEAGLPQIPKCKKKCDCEKKEGALLTEEDLKNAWECKTCHYKLNLKKRKNCKVCNKPYGYRR